MIASKPKAIPFETPVLSRNLSLSLRTCFAKKPQWRLCGCGNCLRLQTSNTLFHTRRPSRSTGPHMKSIKITQIFARRPTRSGEEQTPCACCSSNVGIWYQSTLRAQLSLATLLASVHDTGWTCCHTALLLNHRHADITMPGQCTPRSLSILHKVTAKNGAACKLAWTR